MEALVSPEIVYQGGTIRRANFPRANFRRNRARSASPRRPKCGYGFPIRNPTRARPNVRPNLASRLILTSTITGEPLLHIHAQTPGMTAAPFSGASLPVRIDGQFLFRNRRFFVSEHVRRP